MYWPKRPSKKLEAPATHTWVVYQTATVIVHPSSPHAFIAVLDLSDRPLSHGSCSLAAGKSFLLQHYHLLQKLHVTTGTYNLVVPSPTHNVLPYSATCHAVVAGSVMAMPMAVDAAASHASCVGVGMCSRMQTQ